MATSGQTCLIILFTVCVVLTMPGCTIIGLLADNSLPPETTRIWSQADFKVGVHLTVLTRDSLTLDGEIVGITSAPQREYDEAFRNWSKIGGNASFPFRVGKTVTVTHKSPISGSFEGRVMAYTYNSVVLGSNEVYGSGERIVRREIVLRDVKSIEDSLARQATGDDLEILLWNYHVPTNSVIELRANDGTKDVPLSSIVQFEGYEQHHKETHTFIGLIADITVSAALTASLLLLLL